MYKNAFAVKENILEMCSDSNVFNFDLELSNKKGYLATTQNILDVENIVYGEARNGITIQRYKGLGEMNANDLWETTLNPEKRTMLQVNIDDFDEASEAFGELMGEQVEARRDFIVRNALTVQELDI